MIRLERLMEDLYIPLSQQIKVYSDSKLAISIVKNIVQYDRMKHIRIDKRGKLRKEELIYSIFLQQVKWLMCLQKLWQDQVSNC